MDQRFMKNFFKKILCPIDFDENSIAALEAARDLAVDPDATIYVLHVVTLMLGGFPKQFHAYPLTEQAASARLHVIARKHLEGKVRYELLTRTGDPASEILPKAAAKVRSPGPQTPLGGMLLISRPGPSP
jgi:nucleotide-binding universal stress UspA family protein